MSFPQNRAKLAPEQTCFNGEDNSALPNAEFGNMKSGFRMGSKLNLKINLFRKYSIRSRDTNKLKDELLSLFGLQIRIT